MAAIYRHFKIIILLFCGLPLLANAQIPDKSGIQLNDDRSATFHYHNADVRKVKVECDCKLKHERIVIKRESLHKARMQSDGCGNWTYSTPPLAPELYTYRFRVKNHTIPDPVNPDSIQVNKSQRSVFVVTGTPQADLYVSDSLHGHIDTLDYISDKKTRRVLVYTPPNYHARDTLEWPVLYLLHGINGNEEAWNNRGHAVQALDNLICQNRAVPMVLVMPNANPNKLLSRVKKTGLFKNILLYPAWGRREFERSFPTLDSIIRLRYRVSARPDLRSVAGLSAGAKQAANISNLYGTFGTIGLFSPVLNHRQLPKDSHVRIWIGAGNGDLFHYNVILYLKKLQHKHITHTLCPSIGGHTWINWRYYFTEYVQTIFLKH